MKNLSQICWALEWCTQCDTENMYRNPCHNTDTDSLVRVPDHIPDEQILTYLESTEQEKRMYKKTLYYSLSNGGDGSVSMSLVESAKLATWLQENDICDEGWAEDCSGTIVLESESPITVKSSIESVEDVIEQYDGCDDPKKIEELCKMRDDLNRVK